ncbi:MAG: hypothetical protein LBU98_03950 [Alistipes sp.]|jgi:hypothetical protein|nr:hypothetical protein [Alistipes sp.]
MTLEEFINDKLCPAGVVTAWDETVIATACRLGDTKTLAAKVTELATKAGVEVPADLTLK